MFAQLEVINSRPLPFQFSTAKDLWTDEYISKRMLEYHLNESVDAASRNKNFITLSSEWINSKYIAGNNPDIIDFGCGPGLYTTCFAEMGANVTGIDFSTHSLNYARKTAKDKGLNINYVCQDYLSFYTDKRYDLITMIMCDFCVLSPEQCSNIIRLFYKLLKPGGSVLLDVYTSEFYNNTNEQAVYADNLLNGFWSIEKYYGYLNTFKYDSDNLILDKYTIIEKDKTRVFYNWLQCYTVNSISSMFTSNNFVVDNIFADLCGSELQKNSKEMAIAARKPAL